MTRSRLWDIGILLLAGGILIFFNLGGMPLLDPDEPVYAQTAKEMLAQHSYISPRIFGDFWYDKPPMYYWLVMLSSQFFGLTDFAARFPSAILAILSSIVLYLFICDIFNRRVAFFSSLILLSSLGFFYLGKAAVTDITLMFFLMTSMLALLRKNYYLFYACMGFAVLTKGPIGFFPGVIGLAYFLVSGRMSELRQAKLFSGLLLAFAVFSPWYGAMSYLHGNDFVDTFLGFHNLTRFSSPEHPGRNIWYFYMPVLLIGFFPWCTILLQAGYRSLTHASKYASPLLFMNLWALLVFLFFSAAQTKLVSYILPMYPAISVLVGWYIYDLLDGYGLPERPYGWIAGLFVLTIGFCYGVWTGLKEFAGTEMSSFLLIFVFLFLGVFSLYFLWKRQLQNALVLHVLGMIAFSLTISGVLFPVIAPQFSSRAIATEFKQMYDQQPVYIAKFLRPGFAFYSDIYGKEAGEAGNIEKILKDESSADSWFILRETDYERLSAFSKNQLELVKKVDNNMILKKAVTVPEALAQ